MLDFPNIMKDLRIQRGMTQKELAKLLNVSQSAVYYWESGKREPNLDMLFKISDIFNIGVDDLIGLPDTIPDLSEKEIERLSSYNDNGNTCFYKIELTEEEIEEWEQYHRILHDSFSNPISQENEKLLKEWKN